ncbi:MAG: 2-amino-4-hydroxy-6-hydroxymethyldihydropteridine diphosphokinase [Bryobacteraceae bacterium]
MKTVYLALGTNIGDREKALQTAINHLQSSDLRIKRLSSVYETSPQELTSQPWFLNMVLEAETSLLPLRLLGRVMNIERKMGRKRTVAKGPRVIDIDILLHGSAVVSTPHLTIPHPGIAARRFVLEPLAELVPDLRLPPDQRKVRDLLVATASQAVRKADFVPRIPEG